jgi:hypothetical protein
MMTCKSCGDSFNPAMPVQIDADDEDFIEDFLRRIERADVCPDCAFESAFITHTMKDIDG